jgi:hypothetical protein
VFRLHALQMDKYIVDLGWCVSNAYELPSSTLAQVAQYLCNELLFLACFQRIVTKIHLLVSPVLCVRLSQCKTRWRSMNLYWIE